ncbi:MAG: hypothetical protein CMF22_12005 [Idiomarinaceae bacterium]|nr:hypothetical protein [Idiomarinaceae bacterium]|tara:strand:+ start:13421 stop:14119 length:699 start_codon:yes stop_codon:yes gene_type:complete
MSEETTTQTPLFKEIFEEFNNGVPAEQNRNFMQTASFPLSNVRAFPLVVGAYFEPENEEIKKALGNPSAGLELMSPTEYVTGLRITSVHTQVSVTNIAGSVPATGEITNQLKVSELSDQDHEELTDYLMGLMRTLPVVSAIKNLTHVMFLDEENSTPEIILEEEVRGIISSAIGGGEQFSLTFKSDTTLTFAIWADGKDNAPTSGRIVFLDEPVAQQVVSQYEEGAVEESEE